MLLRTATAAVRTASTDDDDIHRQPRRFAAIGSGRRTAAEVVRDRVSAVWNSTLL